MQINYFKYLKDILLFPDVKKIIKREFLSLLCFIFYYLIGIFTFRYVTGKKVLEPDFIIIVGVFFLLWLIRFIRTIQDGFEEYKRTIMKVSKKTEK